ncbi:MAG: helix-turn-helix domain-containing protein, partial [Eggerthella sp.]|nr:helix-turn-helix domain-containing protein [Eggerthella sp.]
KLLSYLSDQAEAAHASRFVIPFDRQELADYLSVDRSAMCAELSRMKRDGLIDYNRNQFEIVRRSAL